MSFVEHRQRWWPSLGTCSLTVLNEHRKERNHKVLLLKGVVRLHLFGLFCLHLRPGFESTGHFHEINGFESTDHTPLGSPEFCITKLRKKRCLNWNAACVCQFKLLMIETQPSTNESENIRNFFIIPLIIQSFVLALVECGTRHRGRPSGIRCS